MVIGNISIFWISGWRPQSTEDVLILDGTQPTDIWVSAKWAEFTFVFDRNISKGGSKFYGRNITVL